MAVFLLLKHGFVVASLSYNTDTETTFSFYFSQKAPLGQIQNTFLFKAL